ncbi:MAG: class I SAM-dependent methyltransferase [Candidatus Abyssobacteria bacterium SURF_17]|uniref:Class I SAM-dependent methyltransferase n=1 Tax=Candidatus Abyssobacteria bacterium SURF_17 TaxID=2093361 RepID=A0A419F7S5_9BACT|nr:MAG: class I SAM-dependent methyltransferase [Candidatus Abyssubacteria bacterium SURF_17]
MPRNVKTALKRLFHSVSILARPSRLLMRLNQLETDVVSLRKYLDTLEERIQEDGRAPLELPYARGCYDQIDLKGDRFVVSGWMLLPERSLDSFALHINQHRVGVCAVMPRDDVAASLPFMAHARNSGFSFNVQRPGSGLEGMIDVRVVGISRGREVAKTETWYRADLSDLFPTPPANLMLRVGGNKNPLLHLMTGIQTYREFWTAVSRHVNPQSIKSMLDWGCGCGRVTGFFVKFSGIPRIHGCDVDAEAVEWCRKHLGPAEFSAISLHPPTPYPDKSFDLIVSFSVLSHLPRNVQIAWLQEMKRILAPGGLFLATVHGESAALFTFPGRVTMDVLREGIYDDVVDRNLGPIVPGDYYRSVFQTREYTFREYSKYFEILEYKERGGNSFQDLVVMRNA